MSRVITAAAAGAGAGALAAASHAVAGGAISLSATLTISSVSAVLFVLFSVMTTRWSVTQRWSTVVTGVVAVQLLAHVWLESVHPHHGATASHAHGVSGMIAHFFEPAMIMFGAHLVGFLVTVAVIKFAQPLCDSLLPVLFEWARGVFHAPYVTSANSDRLAPVYFNSGVISATDLDLRSPLRRRGPPVVV